MCASVRKCDITASLAASHISHRPPVQCQGQTLTPPIHSIVSTTLAHLIHLLTKQIVHHAMQGHVV